MLASRTRPTPLLWTFTLALFVLFYHSSNVGHIYQPWSFSFELRSENIPANRTLGFGAIVVVSSDNSTRRRPLLQAANVTEIDLTIPHQPEWTEGDLQRFIDGQDNVQRGSILAWLGHRNALQSFLDSGLETALILEDDVDWDIRLRSVQIPLAANTVRQLLPVPRSSYPFANFGRNHSEYWGDHHAWDLLYLGHCGDYFEEITDDGPQLSGQHNLSSLPHLVYKDYTVPAPSDLHPYTQQLFGALGMPTHARVLHRSRFPLCSFGYAVTRNAAQRLLDDLAPAKLQPRGPRAFDVALLNACRKGATLPSVPSARYMSAAPSHPPMHHNSPKPGLRCWTLNSELFHHMPGRSLVDGIGTESGESPGVPPVDLAGQEQTFTRNETSNIDCGFWSGDFAFDEQNMKHLHFLQKHVSRKGKCLKESRRPSDDALQIQDPTG